MAALVLFVVLVGLGASITLIRARHNRSAKRREHPRAIGQGLARAAEAVDDRDQEHWPR